MSDDREHDEALIFATVYAAILAAYSSRAHLTDKERRRLATDEAEHAVKTWRRRERAQRGVIRDTSGEPVAAEQAVDAITIGDRPVGCRCAACEATRRLYDGS